MATTSTNKALKIRRLHPGDDLGAVITALRATSWDEDFDDYTEASLKTFVQDEQRVYLVAYYGDQIAGKAYGYIHVHPEGRVEGYVEQVDTRPEFQRHGVATTMMNKMLEIAQIADADELWVPTDDDNYAAQAFYRSTHPQREDRAVLFTYELSRPDQS